MQLAPKIYNTQRPGLIPNAPDAYGAGATADGRSLFRNASISPIDRDLLIRTVIGEAAKEPLAGQAAVASTVLNRMRAGSYGGSDVQSVIFKKSAFEPWDTRRSELLSYSPDSPQYARAAAVVDAVLKGDIKDPTGGKTHFLNKNTVRARRNGALPDWASGDGQDIGRHTFYAPEGTVQQIADKQAVTDPEVLKALGEAPVGQQAASQPQTEVTDPELLKALGGDEQLAPPIPSGIAGQPPGKIAVPVESGKEIGAGTAFVEGFASNETEQLRYLAQQLYPNEPIDQAIQRFGRDGDVLYHTDDEGRRFRVNPEGMSVQGFLNSVASGAGKALPAGAGAVTGIATAPLATTGVGLAATIGLTATAAGLAEAGRQKLGDWMMGQASTGTVDPISVASEALMATAGQGLGGTASTFYTRRSLRDLARYDTQATADAYEQAAKVGITITPAEATGLATLKAQQKRLANMTATANDMADFTTRRDNEVVTAWDNLLNSVSTSADAETVGKLTRETATDIITGLRKQAQLAASPLYKQAFEEGDRVIWSPELERLTSSPAVQDAMQSAVKTWQDDAIADGFGAANPGALIDSSGIMKVTKGKVPAYPNLQFWDYVKRRLDDQIATAIKEGKGGRVRALTAITKQFRGELDALTAEGGAPSVYAQARHVYGTGAEDTTTAIESAIGLLSGTKDVNILQAARHIFNPTTRSPEMVTKLRSAIEDKNPLAWSAIKRLYMQDVTTDALHIAETGDVLNPAGKIHKAFMSPRVQKNLRAAMTVDEWTNFKGLLATLKRASSVPSLRSDTAFNIWAKEAEQQASEPYWSKVIGAADPKNAVRLWIPQIREFATNRNLERQGKQMVEAITSGDPEALNTMKELRRLSPWDRRWTMLFGHLLTRGAVYGGQALLASPEGEPSAQPDSGAQ